MELARLHNSIFFAPTEAEHFDDRFLLDFQDDSGRDLMR